MKISNHVVRFLWVVGGLVSLTAGIIGIVLPLLPTTPFLLLAAFCFTRGSERMNSWLTGHPRLGPPIRDWQQHGAISKTAKMWAMLAIVATPVVSYFVGAAPWLIGVQLLVLSAVSLFILSRPSLP